MEKEMNNEVKVLNSEVVLFGGTLAKHDVASVQLDSDQESTDEETDTSSNTQAVGCITDGGVRDLQEMKNVGFHAMSRGVTISHAFGVAPVEWDVPVSVFGVTVRPGQLIHADQHGFLVVPEDDEEKLEEATSFMDSLERQQVIVPGRRAMASGVHPSVTAARMQEVRAIQIKTKHEKYGTYQERFAGRK